MIDPQAPFLPKKPVKVGERWVTDEKAIADEFDLKGEDRGTVRCALKSLKQHEGREVAEIGVAMVVTKKENFMTITFDIEGTVLVDVQTGRPVHAELNGPVTFAGEQQAPGEGGQPMKIAIDGTGSAAMRMASKPLAGGASTIPVGAAPAPRPAGDALGGGGGASDNLPPEAIYGSMLQALQRGSFADFQRLHTERAQAELTQEGFQRARERLERIGPPPIESFVQQGDTVTVTLQNGRTLTTFVKTPAGWRCDGVWAK